MYIIILTFTYRTVMKQILTHAFNCSTVYVNCQQYVTLCSQRFRVKH